jgi:FkbM family methyltransferase
MKFPEYQVEIVYNSEYNYLLFKNEDHISNSIRTSGGFDQELITFMNAKLRDIPNGTVLDIGANLGSSVVPLAKHNPQLSFVSFEPQKFIYYQLCANILMNQLNNVDARNMAVGTRSGELTVPVTDVTNATNIGRWSISDLDKSTIGGDTQLTHKVDVITIDSLGITDLKFLKIDVEGFELDVLRGATDTLRNNNYPPFTFECWESNEHAEQRQELFNFIHGLGYLIHRLFTDNYYAERVK